MPTPYLPSRWLITAADTSDDPDIFPFLKGQMFLQLKTPKWSTSVKTSVSGRERRRALWSYPIWLFEIGYEVISGRPNDQELQRLLAFFNAHNGSFQSFLYFDRSDNTVISQAFGLGDGVTTGFQLTRTTATGGISFTEPVRAISGVPTISINGTATSAYTIGAFGMVNFTAPPAAGAVLTWSGNFFFLCRFEQDTLRITQLMQDLWNGHGVTLMTVKP